MNKFYITTSIPYVNAAPHIGFALEAIQADALARFRRQKGDDVFFLTGTDEHGTKVANTAAEKGKTPKEFADENAARFRALAEALNISNDDFIRTSDRGRHWPAAQEVWRRLASAGDIYKAPYEGLYCSGCEAFLSERELEGGKCPVHQKEPERVQEENYFFRLSKYAERLRAILEEGTLSVVPESRKNEVLQLINRGLEDLSVSRPREKLAWGIPVPDDETQTMYVWVDALTNYISALGYPAGERFSRYWPADVHVVGKDIVRFHALIWPAMLLSAGIELPKTLFVHGFITVEGQKMSKSLGNVIDPFELVEKYGTDAVRYYFLREIPSAQDGDFSYEKFETRYTADLSNGLGNLVNRVLTMAVSYDVAPDMPERREVLSHEQIGVRDATKNIDAFDLSSFLEAEWEGMRQLDLYIEQEEPFRKIKTEPERAKEVVARALVQVWYISIALEPFMPETAQKIQSQIQARKPEPLFPRLA